MTRIYEIRAGFGPDEKLLRWGKSRLGNGHDPEIQDVVLGDSIPGDGKALCVGFVPTIPAIWTPERVRAQRIRNMRRRAAREPLFADQIEAKQMRKDYFTIEHAERSQSEKRAMWESMINDFWKNHPPELCVTMPIQSLHRSGTTGDFKSATGAAQVMPLERIAGLRGVWVTGGIWAGIEGNPATRNR